MVLSIYQDEMAKIIYLKILTESTVESVKIPISKEKTSFWHLLEFRNLLTGNLIKTRKNWILKEISNFSPFIFPKKYIEYENTAKIQQICNKLLKDGVETNILPFLISQIGLLDLNIPNFNNFQHQLLAYLGFAKFPSINNSNGKKSGLGGDLDAKNRNQAISDNHLEG